MDTIGIGLIGTGFMGKCHALAFNAVKATFGDVPRPRLEMLCDLEADRAAAKAAEFGFARWTTEWTAIVADPKIDLVSITTPNAVHREIAVAALAAGKHVCCEKPMGLTLADAEAMAEAAGAAKGRTRLGYNYTVNPAVQHARRLIAEGAIGRVIDVRGAFDEDYMADPALPWSWRCRVAEAGLGVLGDLMCHLVAMVHMTAGPIAAVMGSTAIAHRERPLPDRPGTTGRVDNDDTAHALVRFASGATGVLAASRVAHGRKNGLRIEVHGSTGMIVFDQERLNELQLFIADGEPATRGFRTLLTGPLHPPYGTLCPAPGHGLGFNDLKVIEVAEFLGAIATGAANAFDFAEGLEVERVIDAVARSANERRWIEVG
jgi:predicted dehydrogenase